MVKYQRAISIFILSIVILIILATPGWVLWELVLFIGLVVIAAVIAYVQTRPHRKLQPRDTSDEPEV